jgi:signal transduction histidine kinase
VHAAPAPADISHELRSPLTIMLSSLDLVEDAVVLGNTDYLKQLFMILLENAFKYTPEGGKSR